MYYVYTIFSNALNPHLLYIFTISLCPTYTALLYITDIYIRESVLEIISLRYMVKFKKGGCDAPFSNVHFMDGEFCPASEINAVSRPVVSSATLPSLPSLSKSSPPASLNSVNGTTTTDSCTESTSSENNFDVYHSTR